MAHQIVVNESLCSVYTWRREFREDIECESFMSR